MQSDSIFNWIFTKEEISSSPSRKCGVDAEKELSDRQQGAKLIQDMGQRLQVTQLVINTAIVYMHRFYMFHSFTKFHRNKIAPAALFLAAKVEEQPRKLEHLLKVAHYIVWHADHVTLDTKSDLYKEKEKELKDCESILIQTLGFDFAIDHPHAHVVKCFQMVRTSNSAELAQTSYFMATNSLHMTTMCLQYKPSVVACVCIYIVCKWSNYEIQRFTESEGKDWFTLVDPTVTLELLQSLTNEFLAVFDKYPNRLKKLMHGGTCIGEENPRPSSIGAKNIKNQQINSSGTGRSHDIKSNPTKSGQTSKTIITAKEYSDKIKEKERRERMAQAKEKVAFPPPYPPSYPGSIISNRPPLSSGGSSSQVQPSSTVPTTYHSQLSNSRSLPMQSGLHKLDSNKVPVDISKQPPSVLQNIPTRNNVPSHGVKDYNRKELFVYKPDRISSSLKISDKISGLKEEKSADSSYDKLKAQRHQQQAEWYSKNVEKKTNGVKPEIKILSKDHRNLENRELKSDINNKKKNGVQERVSDNSIRKINSEKIELKEASDILNFEDIKPQSSFIFNNDSFNIKDFLNPSEMPPDDIFDTGDTNIPTEISNEDFFSYQTAHHKLSPSPSRSPVSKSNSSTTVSTTKASQSLPNTLTKADLNKPLLQPKHIIPSKPVSQPLISSIIKETLSEANKSLNSTVALFSPSNRKKELLPPPLNTAQNLIHYKPKVKPTSDVWISSFSKDRSKSQHSVTSSHSTAPKECKPAQKLVNLNANNVTPTQVASSSTSKTTPQKISSQFVPKSLIIESFSKNILFDNKLDVADAVASEGKKSKKDHSHHSHKRKEKKKHKHKEKNKHKDREHKESKKNKKHKKNKDKEREKSKKKDKHSKEDSIPTLPLKITLPKSGSQDAFSPEQEVETRTIDTHGRIKLTIPKSRLQVSNLDSNSDSSTSSRHKVKLKLPKESSKKRERSESKKEKDLHLPASKVPRPSVPNFLNPQVGNVNCIVQSSLKYPNNNLHADNSVKLSSGYADNSVKLSLGPKSSKSKIVPSTNRDALFKATSSPSTTFVTENLRCNYDSSYNSDTSIRSKYSDDFSADKYSCSGSSPALNISGSSCSRTPEYRFNHFSKSSSCDQMFQTPDRVAPSWPPMHYSPRKTFIPKFPSGFPHLRESLLSVPPPQISNLPPPTPFRLRNPVFTPPLSSMPLHKIPLPSDSPPPFMPPLPLSKSRLPTLPPHSHS